MHLANKSMQEKFLPLSAGGAKKRKGTFLKGTHIYAF